MIIGLSGYARSGKDTVANILVEKHGFTKLAFADPMREALYRLDPRIEIADMQGVSLAQAVDGLGWENLKVDSPDVRGLLQRMGTEVGRGMFGENIWVDLALKEAAKYENVVFSDVRFKNEAEAVRAAGGSLWRIERPGTEAANAHISEHDLDDYQFNATLNNDRTAEDLYEVIEQGIAFEMFLNGMKPSA
jgi:hypothetical protein